MSVFFAMRSWCCKMKFWISNTFLGSQKTPNLTDPKCERERERETERERNMSGKKMNKKK